MAPKWNVKAFGRRDKTIPIAVLMAPKWNLKDTCTGCDFWGIGINGSKVECKVFGHGSESQGSFSINGSKVECKVLSMAPLFLASLVLMAPKWNVKGAHP